MCIGSNGLYSGSGLTLKSCVTNDCTSYLESTQINNYAPSMVYAQGCGSFSNGSNNYNPTPSTPPSYTPPPPPAPTPVPTPSPTPPPDDVASEIANYTEAQNPILSGEYDLNIPFEESGLDGKIQTLSQNLQTKYASLTNGLFVDCKKVGYVQKFKCDTAYLGALWNFFVIICRYYFGVLKGIGQVAKETVFDIWNMGTIRATDSDSVESLGNTLVYNNENRASTFIKLIQNVSYDNIKAAVIKAGEQTASGAVDFLDNMISTVFNDWGFASETVGYWFGWIGANVLSIYYLFRGVWKLVSVIYSGYNVAKSLINAENIIRIGTTVIRNVRSVGNAAKVAGSTLYSLAKEGQFINVYRFLGSQFKRVPAPIAQEILKKEGNPNDILRYFSRDNELRWIQNGGLKTPPKVGYNGWQHVVKELKDGTQFTRLDQLKNANVGINNETDLLNTVIDIISTGTRVDSGKFFVYSKAINNKILKVVVGPNGNFVTITF